MKKTDIREITPEGSLSPIFLDPSPVKLSENITQTEQETQSKHQISAIKKLKAFGLTDNEIAAMFGTAPLKTP